MAKTKARPAKRSQGGSSFGKRNASSGVTRDLADYLAAKARDNGRRIPMGVVHRKVSQGPVPEPKLGS